MIRVALFRFRATFKRERADLVALVLLIGLIGGLALGVLAGARRTQSSYSAFLRSTNPSDLSIVGAPPTKNGTLARAIGRLPGVHRVESYSVLVAGPIMANGAPTKAATNTIPLGSIDGLGFDQDRLTAIQGRMADPARADEVVVTTGAARAFQMHVGERVPIGVFTSAQFQLPAFGTAKVQPTHRTEVTVVGIVKFNNNIVQDDVDANGEGAGNIIFTPAFTRPLTRCCNGGLLFSGFQLDGGARAVSAVEGEIERAMPPNAAYYVHVTSVFEAQAERAIKPEAIALGVFGAIALLATLLIAGQVIGRRLRADNEDLETLRALGATPAMRAADGLIGIIGAVVVGTLLAATVSVALSPLAPVGPARQVYPNGGIAFDWAVIGIGIATMIIVLSVVAILFAILRAPYRARRRAQAGAGSSVARTAANAGASVATVTGIRFALESGRGRSSAPVRSAMLGATLAIVVVTGTLTFGTSLRTLVSHPALYGWNWNDEILTNGGGGDIPMSAAHAVLDHDHDVAAWSGVYFDSLRIDGQTVPIIGTQAGTAVQPPILSGHGLEATNEIVLGGTTLTQLHKHVGDTVEASYGNGSPTRLKIVGTATMPAVGPADQLHLSMGTGAVIAYQQLPYQVRNSGEQHAPDNAFAPNAIFVRTRPGANPAAALASLRRRVAAYGNGVSVVSAQRPGEIVNYRSMGATPALLGVALAFGALSALVLTLMASVKRRRRDLALLKALGFTRRQVAAAVGWQSTIAVGVGVVVGVPLGIVAGRALWNLFAHDLHVVPQPSIPIATICLVGIGALVLANIVAVIPGRQAARTPPALVLQSE